jgi:hypothetical protein
MPWEGVPKIRLPVIGLMHKDESPLASKTIKSSAGVLEKILVASPTRHSGSKPGKLWPGKAPRAIVPTSLSKRLGGSYRGF